MSSCGANGRCLEYVELLGHVPLRIIDNNDSVLVQAV